MDTHEALLNRRSIRKYLKDPVPPETIKKIMTAAIWAPSGSNTQPWRFYVATGTKRDQLVQAMIDATGPEAPSVEAYDVMVERIEQEGSRRQGEDAARDVGLRQMGEETMKFVRFGSIRFYQAPVAIVLAVPKEMAGSAHQSIGAAMENLLLAAHAEGLGTCWLGMPLMYKEKLIEVLNIREDEVPVASASLGYPDHDSPVNRMERVRLPFDETVHLLS
jgi:nitroreductase